MMPAEFRAISSCCCGGSFARKRGITPVAPAEKWRGGTLVLRPGTPGLQEKSWPIETFFHKVVMLRNRLRTLEQQLNASDLPDDVKVKLQAYISGCYGSLTSFNVLFNSQFPTSYFRGHDSWSPSSSAGRPQLDVAVGDLLHFLEAAPLLVFGDDVVLQQLLQALVGVAPDLAQAVAAFFGQLVDVASTAPCGAPR